MSAKKSGLPPVLDACCGSRKFWFDPCDPRALYIDQRAEVRDVVDQSKASGLRRIVVAPDKIADFRSLPFPDESFAVVVFDPPHIKANRTGKNSRMAINYGTLGANWREDLAAGFRECFRVLQPSGVLVFKWAETNIRAAEVLALSPTPPLFGNRMPKLSGTHWVVFMKEPAAAVAAPSPLARSATA
jgi:SAM-dependent methyltransferase